MNELSFYLTNEIMMLRQRDPPRLTEEMVGHQPGFQEVGSPCVV